MKTRFILPIAATLLAATVLLAQEPASEFVGLAKIRLDLKSRRVGSYDRTGGNADNVSGVADGAKVNIMDVKGAGIITHIWITLAPGADTLNRNDVIIRMYWDGKTFPSVEAPVGAFFGNGWGEAYNFVSAPLAATPGWGRSYVSYFAMPFSDGRGSRSRTRAAARSMPSTSTSTTRRCRSYPRISAGSMPGTTIR